MKHALAAVAVLLVVPPCLHAVTYLVDPQGTGDFATIQEAIDSTVSGDTVKLADGVFTGEGNRDLDFGGKAIAVCSGSGNAILCVIDCEGGPGSLHSGFYFHSGEDTQSVVKDIGITGGYDVYGGAVTCIGSSPKFEGCRISYNEATAKGGGFYFEDASGAVVAGCRIVWNESQGDGGAICIDGCGPIITGSRISANTASINGGGIFSTGGFETVYDCTISGNYAFAGGGIYASGATPEFTSTTISGNRASYQGGGAVCRSSTVCSFYRCILWGNCAYSGTQAYLRDSELVLNCCAFERGGVTGSGQVGQINGEVTEDPIFCSPLSCGSAPIEDGDYAVSANSPCLPFDSPCDEQIGILKIGCGPDSPVRHSSWGSIKSLFRR